MVVIWRGVLGIGRVGSNFVGAPSLTIAIFPSHKQSSRSIVTKENLRLPENYPEPWPYRERGFSALAFGLLDRSAPHLHVNSKLIVVEGNVGAQKTQTARELADALGFYYYPEFKMDDILIDRYGNDLRDYYEYFPESFRVPDAKMFFKKPFADGSAVMQWRMLQGRFDQFYNALAHIFNTGQGVVLERSVLSDCVFINAMRAKNYVGPEFFKFYYYVRKHIIRMLPFWPHLMIYLDTPVKVCLENIRKRGNPDEVEVIDEKFLKIIEESYKDVLNETKKYSRMLAYDWTVPGHTDTIVEDIEKTEFDFAEWHSSDVFVHWTRLIDEWNTAGYREYVTQKTVVNSECFYQPNHIAFEVGELAHHHADLAHVEDVMKNLVLKSPKLHGFIRERGDPIKGLWFFRNDHVAAEPWYEYYWREKWYADMYHEKSYFDSQGKSFNPLYTHH